MQRLTALLTGTTILLLLAACASLAGPADDALALQHRSTSNVYWFADMSQVEGAGSSIVRNAHGVSVNTHTNGLGPGHAVTNWFVVFNEPGECSDGICDENDVLPPGVNPAAKVGVHYAAGNVVGGSGISSFAGSLQIGDEGGAVFGYPLMDSHRAEVHIVVRTHGPMDPANMPRQIHDIELECDPAICYDVQFSVHPPAE